MHGLWPQGVEVPEHIRVFQVSLRIPLLRVDKAREENGIPDEKYRRVVSHEIPNSILGIKLQCEASGISNGVRRSRLPTYRGKPYGDRSLFSDGRKHLGGAIFGDVVRYLEIAESSRPFSVDNTLWDSLPVKMGHLFDEVVVLNENRAPYAHC